MGGEKAKGFNPGLFQKGVLSVRSKKNNGIDCGQLAFIALALVALAFSSTLSSARGGVDMDLSNG